MKHEAAIRDPLIIGNKSLHDISEDIAKPIEKELNIVMEPVEIALEKVIEKKINGK